MLLPSRCNRGPTEAARFRMFLWEKDVRWQMSPRKQSIPMNCCGRLGLKTVEGERERERERERNELLLITINKSPPEPTQILVSCRHWCLFGKEWRRNNPMGPIGWGGIIGPTERFIHFQFQLPFLTNQYKVYRKLMSVYNKSYCLYYRL